MNAEHRPDRHALLELHALLAEVAMLRGEGDATRFAADARYRWVLHRLWIAVGNEALAYTRATKGSSGDLPGREPIRCGRACINCCVRHGNWGTAMSAAQA